MALASGGTTNEELGVDGFDGTGGVVVKRKVVVLIACPEAAVGLVPDLTKSSESRKIDQFMNQSEIGRRKEPQRATGALLRCRIDPPSA